MVNNKSYTKLVNHFEKIKKLNIKDILSEGHLNTFSLEVEDLYADFSKNLFSQETLEIFLEMAKENNLQEKIVQTFKGAKTNFTENRSVLHTALRDTSSSEINLNSKNILNNIRDTKDSFLSFVENVRNGTIKGINNNKIDTIVNIGIGGSYLGVEMAYTALKHYNNPNNIKVYFIANVDGANCQDILSQINAESTMFVIASKTFTTQETMLNANMVKNWFINQTNSHDISKNFVAISTNLGKVSEFGINPSYAFGFDDFIGGRYSIWGPIGIALAFAIGKQGFEEFLNGAQVIDNHLINTELDKNIPFLMACVSIWYNNFFDMHSYSIIPYSYQLRYFTKFIQQMEMESNGKSVDRNSNNITYKTSPVVFGEPGTDSQHSFFQLIHQGTSIIPCDFIGFINNKYADNKEQNDTLIANMIAQSEALAEGKSLEDVKEELKEKNISPEEIEKLAPHKVFSGNRPSNTFLFSELNPKTLGMLCAMYEHKIMIQGFIWNINSYDQWGVELGKVLASRVLSQIKSGSHASSNISTSKLIKKFIEKQS